MKHAHTLIICINEYIAICIVNKINVIISNKRYLVICESINLNMKKNYTVIDTFLCQRYK